MSAPPTIAAKRCADCLFYLPPFKAEDPETLGRCAKAFNPFRKIFGKIEYRNVEVERDEYTGCGPEGRNFQARRVKA